MSINTCQTNQVLFFQRHNGMNSNLEIVSDKCQVKTTFKTRFNQCSYTGLLTKDKSSKTNVQYVSLHFAFLVGENWLISVLNNLVNNQNIQLNAETINQASNCHILKVLGRLYSHCLCE